MSLINDALKRAKQNHQKNPPPTAPGSQLRPVEATRVRSSSAGKFWPFMLVAVALAIAVAGAVIMWQAIRKDDSGQPTNSDAAATKPARTARAAPTPAAETPAPSAQPVSNTVPAVVPAPMTPPAQTQPAPAIRPASPPQPAFAADPPSLPKLQGIFYQPNRPMAILNGKTVLVGNTSGGYQVVAIDQKSVTLVYAGQTNVLSMGE